MKRHSLAILTAVLISALPAVPAAAHMTPSVVLETRAAFIRESLSGAQRYFERAVDLGKHDYERIAREAAGIGPTGRTVRFYSGQDAEGKDVGVAFFVQVNTMHGPIELGMAMAPGDSVMAVSVVRATVETKPWVTAVARAGILRRFVGLQFGDDPARALDGFSRRSLGAMPYYFAGAVAEGVKQGLGLYHVVGRPREG
jgi:hypothetical protein